MKSLEIKIGLEVHTQLTSLKTKLFCGCTTDYRGKDPNTTVCPVCLGLPGALPVINRETIKYAVMAALALKCNISNHTSFFRKNYFYPDMPKNFQISQYDRAGGVPVAVDGYLPIGYGKKRVKIRISRVHLEEDPGRLIHLGSIDRSTHTLVDYNRAGITLLEIVTDPNLASPREARIFLQTLRSTLEHLGVFDGSLEGAMRCDANISVAGGNRVEIKNISSFREVERALSFEFLRQKDLLRKRLTIFRETRHWDEKRKTTITLRSKEREHDYRYFPEPNLVPVAITEDFIEKVRLQMPELPQDRIGRFVASYGIPRYDARILVSYKALADFFEECVKLYNKPKEISNWMMSDLLRSLRENDLELSNSKITPEHLVEMIKLIDDGIISGKIGKRLLPETLLTGQSPGHIVKKKNLTKITSHDELEEIISKIFTENPQAVEDALGDEKAVHFLVGQLMESTKGKADPELSIRMINKKLETLKANNKIK